MSKNIHQMAQEGDKDAQTVLRIMESSDYQKSNGSAESQQARAVVDAFFKARFGTGPAQGMVHNNNTGRGGRGDT